MNTPFQPSHPSQPDHRVPIDPRFVFEWHQLDDPGEGQRFSTYWDVEPLCRGPQPVPEWVITDRAAVDSELGLLKTGKEADVHLVERAAGDQSVVMAVKRYRGIDHRDFTRSTTYTEGRRVRNTRDARAMAKKSAHGRAVAAGQWAVAEWDSLTRLWSMGVPVPYPVQIDGTEIVMELILHDGEPAPRLARERPPAAVLSGWFDQLREAMLTMTNAGLVHGDLSPYNTLAAGERLVIIDVPQMVDLAANPAGPGFLHRDCLTMGDWFAARGLAIDGETLYAELMAAAF